MTDRLLTAPHSSRGDHPAGKPFILGLVHLPPPVTGVSTMSSLAMGSKRLNEIFDLKTLPLQTADAIEDIGRFRLRKVFKILRTGAQLLTCCIFKRPDLVYFTLTPNGGAFFRDLFYVGILKMTRTKRLYHIHAKGIPAGMRTPFRKALYAWAFKDAKVILLSPALHAGFSEVVDLKDCFVLPNGIPDAASGNGSSGAQSSPDHPPRILFLSTVGAAKGPLVLLEALSQLYNSGFEFRALFAGEWENTKIQQSFCKMVQDFGLNSAVEYCGPKYDDEKCRMLGSADLFVFPTCNDTFPLVILEAMSFSLPVVSTYEGAIPSIVLDNETGFLAPVQNADLLADRIARLLKDPGLRKRFGQASRKRFEERFTFDVFERRLESIFCECV